MLKTAALLVVLAVVAGINADEEYCNKKLCKDDDHTLCIYQSPSGKCDELGKTGLSTKERQEVVDVHNKLRAKVASGDTEQPPAGNMRQMSWDHELAKVAQRWTDQCHFGHDGCRNVKRFSVGQNAYVEYANGKGKAANWTAAANNWFDEIKDFDTGNLHDFEFDEESGHYSQLLWADTYKVGCGFAQYKGDKYYESLYICDYGPAGNVEGGDMYMEGNPCSDCPSGTACQDKLCA